MDWQSVSNAPNTVSRQHTIRENGLRKSKHFRSVLNPLFWADICCLQKRNPTWLLNVECPDFSYLMLFLRETSEQGISGVLIIFSLLNRFLYYSICCDLYKHPLAILVKRCKRCRSNMNCTTLENITYRWKYIFLLWRKKYIYIFLWQWRPEVN